MHTTSNHPPSIIKQNPNWLATDYSIILPTSTFSTKTNIYDSVLKDSGYEQTLEYTPPKNKPKHRNRNITWFNPPYNKSIMSNISWDFLNLISKHFPIIALLAKIFNGNNIKVSYCCTSNKSQIIKGHNKKIETLHSNTHPNKQCNYSDKETCPLQGNCQQKKIVYRATVKSSNSLKQYIGAMEGTIKQRIYNHKLSVSNRNYLTNISLSTHIWNLKDMNISSTIIWGNTKTSTCLQRDIKKMSPLPPWETLNYHTHHKTLC